MKLFDCAHCFVSSVVSSVASDHFLCSCLKCTAVSQRYTCPLCLPLRLKNFQSCPECAAITTLELLPSVYTTNWKQKPVLVSNPFWFASNAESYRAHTLQIFFKCLNFVKYLSKRNSSFLMEECSDDIVSGGFTVDTVYLQTFAVYSLMSNLSVG
ncbi:hypothetical protein BY458DRAFT_545342 [Sporodiniella umbellata]|nr:hypothetical protein BY458DRAFT_545342 [Sporodiniella umbellata]